MGNRKRVWGIVVLSFARVGILSRETIVVRGIWRAALPAFNYSSVMFFSVFWRGCEVTFAQVRREEDIDKHR